MCWWRSKSLQTSSTFTAVSIKLDDWHERLGHVSRNAILKFDDKVERLTMIKGDHLSEDCESCALSKHHRRPFQEMNKRQNKSLRLMHSDLCDKFSVEALEGE